MQLGKKSITYSFFSEFCLPSLFYDDGAILLDWERWIYSHHHPRHHSAPNNDPHPPSQHLLASEYLFQARSGLHKVPFPAIHRSVWSSWAHGPTKEWKGRQYLTHRGLQGEQRALDLDGKCDSVFRGHVAASQVDICISSKHHSY